MIKYKSIKTPETAKEYLNMLKTFGEDNWSWQQDKFGISIFYKKVTAKVDIVKKEAVKTPEWEEFRLVYKDIKNAGLSDNRLIEKYNKLVSEGLHKKIMDNLKDYKLYLEVKKKQQYALMASTYINQSRYNDEWEIVEDMSRKFINEIYKEKQLNKQEIEYINTEISNYEHTHKREVTSGVVKNMIELRLNK